MLPRLAITWIFRPEKASWDIGLDEMPLAK